jgi:hypothetical protein
VFDLGYPPDDLEGAAALLVRYEREGPRTPEFYESFAMMTHDFLAIRARAEVLKGEGRR